MKGERRGNIRKSRRKKCGSKRKRDHVTVRGNEKRDEKGDENDERNGEKEQRGNKKITERKRRYLGKGQLCERIGSLEKAVETMLRILEEEKEDVDSKIIKNMGKRIQEEAINREEQIKIKDMRRVIEIQNSGERESNIIKEINTDERDNKEIKKEIGKFVDKDLKVACKLERAKAIGKEKEMIIARVKEEEQKKMLMNKKYQWRKFT